MLAIVLMQTAIDINAIAPPPEMRSYAKMPCVISWRNTDLKIPLQLKVLDHQRPALEMQTINAECIENWAQEPNIACLSFVTTERAAMIP